MKLQAIYSIMSPDAPDGANPQSRGHGILQSDTEIRPSSPRPADMEKAGSETAFVASGRSIGSSPSMVSQKFIEEQQQILRLTTPMLKSTPGAPFAQDDSSYCAAYF